MIIIWAPLLVTPGIMGTELVRAPHVCFGRLHRSAIMPLRKALAGMNQRYTVYSQATSKYVYTQTIELQSSSIRERLNAYGGR
jgi:hypothetical protein